MKLVLAGVLAFAAAAHAAQPAGLSEGWGMKLFVAVLLALVAAVSGFGSPPKDREAETPMRMSYAASLGGAPSMPRLGWQPTSEGGTDPNNCVRRGPPHSPTLCEAASECSISNGAQGGYIASPTCRRRGTVDDEDGNPIVVGDDEEEDEESDDWCAMM